MSGVSGSPAPSSGVWAAVAGVVALLCLLAGITLFVLAFAIGVPHHDSALFTLPGSIVFCATAPIAGGSVWASSRRDQIGAIRKSHSVHGLVEGQALGARLPASTINRAFLGSVRAAAIGYATVCAVTLLLVIAALVRVDQLVVFASLAGVGIAVLVLWAILASPLYLRPRDIAVLARARPLAKVWMNSTTAGLTEFWRRFGPGPTISPRLKSVGYIVVNPNSVELWQRDGRELQCVLALPRSAISSVATGSLSLAFAAQSGISMTVAGGIEPPVVLPLIPLGPGLMLIVGRAATAFEREYNAR